MEIPGFGRKPARGSFGTIVGLTPSCEYQSKRISVSRGARLYLYSDGAYEVSTQPVEMLLLDGLEAIIARVSLTQGPHTAEILKRIRAAHGKRELQDDLSLLEVIFD